MSNRSDRSDRPKSACAICRRELSQGAATATYPFCSPRCKMIDLGNWLGDGYVIAGPSLESINEFDADALAQLEDLLREPS